MKLYSKFLAVTTLSVVSMLVACSHSKPLGQRLFKPVTTYAQASKGALKGRKIAQENDFIVHNGQFKLYNDPEMPAEVTIFKGVAGIETTIVVAKDDNLQCWMGEDFGTLNDAGTAVLFQSSEDAEVRCKYVGDSHAMAIGVDYYTAKTSESWEAIRDEERERLLEAKKGLEEDRYADVIPYLEQFKILDTYEMKVQANEPNAVSFPITAYDFVQIESADGDIYENSKKNSVAIKPTGLDEKAIAKRFKTKAQKKTLVFKDLPPYALVCRLLNAKSELSVVSVGGQRRGLTEDGLLKCSVNGVLRAFKKHKGEITVKIILVKKAAHSQQIDSLLNDKESGKIAREKKKDEENSAAVKTAVSEALQENVKLQGEWVVLGKTREAVELARREEAARYAEELRKKEAEHAKDLEDAQAKADSEKGELEDEKAAAERRARELEDEKNGRDNAKRDNDKRSHEQMEKDADKYAPRAIMDEFNQLYYTFSVKPTEFKTTRGKDPVSYVDLAFVGGKLVYMSKRGDYVHESQNVFKPHKLIPTRTFFDTLKPKEKEIEPFVICANSISNFKKVTENFNNRVKTKAAPTSNEVMGDLRRFKVESENVCKPTSAEPKKIPVYTRVAKYRFCYERKTERVSNGREWLDLLVLYPQQIEVDYYSERFKRTETRIVTNQEHPFFTTKVSMNEIPGYLGDGGCVESSKFFPSYAKDGSIEGFRAVKSVKK